jgi:hypothetical protein
MTSTLGDYFQIRYPTSFVATSLEMGGQYNRQLSSTDGIVAVALNMVLAGSNDGTIWYLISSIANASFINGSLTTFNFSNTNPYSYYRMIATKFNTVIYINTPWITANFTLFNNTTAYPSSDNTTGYSISSNLSMNPLYYPLKVLGNRVPDNQQSNGLIFLAVTYSLDGTYNGTQSTIIRIPLITSISSDPACFVEGTRVLTEDGYKAIEMLNQNDRIITDDERSIEFRILKFMVSETNELTAPYLIQPNAFGKGFPNAQVRLSPIHKIQVRKGVWLDPKTSSMTNPLVTQYDLNKSVTYYHIVTNNYLQDNIITENMIVETFGMLPSTIDIYTWNENLKGFTRIGYETLEEESILVQEIIV